MENTPEQWYKNLPILTRIGLTTFFLITVLVQLDILDPKLLSLHWPLVLNKLQVWRLLTSCCFFGTFSFQFLFQLYFFSSFSSKLEQNEIFARPGDYLFFLITQILLLDVLSLVLSWPNGFPMLGPSLVFAILYYWSRREPYANLSFFSFTIKGYQFPFALVFFQLLIGGNIWMDLLGLATGHIYYFLKEVVPMEYGKNFISTPAFMVSLMTRYAGGGAATAGAAPAGRPGGGGGGGAPPPAPPPPRFGGQGHRLGGN
mmetsp:Transcript_56786/g.122755  ORF Transcript_56786/g.122755 Transcript_56786/m.122755 type:complete len:258 (-) Transcript_56786:102-875(-)|eukprot:CAMPEP_0170569898 /NCGR_PEP_ID=MMETSP0224-20130122/811_1 /TAXON_ID=285029 /ORGANISM="Togula jolla, Strain CCCM 725" /LENGTH=257 /DNA_ID=CAMNT_0010892117 /DNA_START=66 /DNA_END=839 /DNA_ORIENTATION=+